MRAELWQEQPSNDVAVGYRFDIPGRWSDPEESRIEEHEDSELVITLLKESSFFLDTQFADREGRPCGKRRVKFSSPDPFSFLVDNSDLGDLLRTIAACAVN